MPMHIKKERIFLLDFLYKIINRVKDRRHFIPQIIQLLHLLLCIRIYYCIIWQYYQQVTIKAPLFNSFIADKTTTFEAW